MVRQNKDDYTCRAQVRAKTKYSEIRKENWDTCWGRQLHGNPCTRLSVYQWQLSTTNTHARHDWKGFCPFDLTHNFVFTLYSLLLLLLSFHSSSSLGVLLFLFFNFFFIVLSFSSLPFFFPGHKLKLEYIYICTCSKIHLKVK